MLCINNYSQEYIDECRARVESQVSAYKTLVKTADQSAIPAFEPVFFNNMVIVLDSYFTHRSRTIEGKDGNPMNEVRVLAASMVSNNSTLAAEKTIKQGPDRSVLKYRVGDEIKLTQAGFVLLAKAFFDAIEGTFLPTGHARERSDSVLV